MISLKGSRTLTVVRPENPEAITGDALKAAAFDSSLRDDSTGEPVSGFVSGLDSLDEDPSLGGTGSYLCFAWREDKKSVPGAAVKLAVAEQVKKEKEKTGGMISRARRNEIKEQVKIHLTSRAPWASSTVDLCFCQDTGLLFVFEGSEKKLDAILSRIADACGTDFERGWTVQDLAGLYGELLDGSRDAGDGWNVCENGACTLAKEDDGEGAGKITAVNAGEAVKAALEDGFHPAGLSLRVENGDGEALCTFSPALESGGRGWTLKQLKLHVAPGEEEDDDELLAACEAFARTVDILNPLFAEEA